MELDVYISLNCDIGCARAKNEDMILISGETFRNRSEVFSTIVHNSGRFVAAVADGMGGHRAGEIASEMALNMFDDFIVNLPKGFNDKDFQHVLDNEIRRIHNSINMYGQSHSGCLGLGTTLTAWLTYENRIYIINAGDSRIYRLRNGILCQLTTDHSERNKNNNPTLPSNVIYNSLGGGGNSTFVDIKEITDKVFAEDVFLLCSDGLSDMLTEEEIEDNLITYCNSNALVEHAKSKGGLDNISVTILKINKLLW